MVKQFFHFVLQLQSLLKTSRKTNFLIIILLETKLKSNLFEFRDFWLAEFSNKRECLKVDIQLRVVRNWKIKRIDTEWENKALKSTWILFIINMSAKPVSVQITNSIFLTEEQPGEYKDFLFQPNVQQYQNGSLSFLHISKENEGQYLCEAKNNIGAGVSKVIVLKVNGKCFIFHLNDSCVQRCSPGKTRLRCR